jgi:hypothetical protein
MLVRSRGAGGGVTTPIVTPMATHPDTHWVWGDTSDAKRNPPDPKGKEAYQARLLGREITGAFAEINQLYDNWPA